MNTVIKVENISKKYLIGHENKERYTALRDVLTNSVKRMGNRLLHPFSLQGTDQPSKEEFWALKDVSLEVKQGERIGIIGRNGAGKSTLLKLLSRITEPTEGRMRIKGRVSSLLEVGTGFHPELTGKENIYLNGAILGMSRTEINQKFDEIVAFAEVDKFLDTPVKRYSSGMQVRLAFAVAAHLEPEILLVDEVLAVGDAQFQKKCLGKMEEVAGEGRTVLFVSHNMGSISNLCSRSILLDKGELTFDGMTSEAIQTYLSELEGELTQEWIGNAGDENVRLHRTWVKSLDEFGLFHTAADILVGIKIIVLKPISGFVLGFTLFSEFGYELARVLYDDREGQPVPIVQPGIIKQTFLIPANTLAMGGYSIEFDVGIHRKKRIVKEEGKLNFELVQTKGLGLRFPTPGGRGRSGLFRPDWVFNRKD